MSDLPTLVAFLLVAKYAATGAWVWLRYGYEGYAFVTSKDFNRLFLEWKMSKREKLDVIKGAKEHGYTTIGSGH